MHVIQSIEVVGLRGRTEPLVLTLDPHVNFLIGRNGSGKTTLINLVNSALMADVAALVTTPFSILKIKLRRAGSNKRPTIEVSKITDEGPTEPNSLQYMIRTEAGKPPVKFQIYFPDERFARSAWRYSNQYAHRFQEPFLSPVSEVRAAIAKLVDTTWLSVHRAASGKSGEPEERFDSPVDKRLAQVARDFGTYFSVLDKKAADETNSFQQNYFLSLISPPRAESLNNLLKEIDVDKEKEAIQAIFSEFKLKPNQYTSKLETFRKKVKKAKDDYRPSSTVDANDFLTLIDVLRIHGVTENWHGLLKTRAEIYSPKDKFVNAINNLFLRKNLSINAGNEPVFHTDAGDPLPLMALSSGEKQMFILLGETLLQRDNPYVFMADEPELSLHIDWQLSLVPNLRDINPGAQIIFATHSPDIVGAYEKQAIDLEDYR